MAIIRVMFLVMTLSSIITSDTTIGADHNEDRIGTILSYMVQMRDDVRLLSQKVEGVQEEVNGVKDKVDDVIDQQGKIEHQVNAVENHLSTVEKKVEKVDRDVFVASVPWTFIGFGLQGSTDEQISSKDGLTLGECIEYCQQHRESAGVEWNGMVYQASTGWCGCDKNSQGISTGYDGYVLYRVV